LQDSDRLASVAAWEKGEPRSAKHKRPEHDASCDGQRLHLDFTSPLAGPIVGLSLLSPAFIMIVPVEGRPPAEA
jgi:hypothetical protein